MQLTHKYVAMMAYMHKYVKYMHYYNVCILFKPIVSHGQTSNIFKKAQFNI